MIKKNIFGLLFIFITAFSISLNSQIKETSDIENLNLGLFIAPVYEVSRINKTSADFIGINAGFISRGNEIGFSLQKLNSTITHDIDELDARLNIEILSGEIYYNRYFNFYKELYLSIGLSIGSAYTQLKYKEALLREKSSGQLCCWEEIFASDTHYFIKPRVDLNYCINNNIILNAGTGYRITSDLKMDYKLHPYVLNFSNKDFTDFFISFSLQYIFKLE
jgi:hypothetical protein